MLVCIQMLFYSRIWCKSVYRCCFIPEFDVSLYTDVVLFQNLMLVLQYAREEKHMDLIICLGKIPEMLDNMKHAVARMHGKLEMLYAILMGFFLAFDFCQFCVVIGFFHPRHKRQWPPPLKGFLYQILFITLFSYLNSWERASISLFNFYNVFGMMRSLTEDWTRGLPHSMPALYH